MAKVKRRVQTVQAPNYKRGVVPIEIAGEQYALLLDMNAVAAADSQLGSSLLMALQQGRIDAVRLAIQVGLQNKYNPRDAWRASRNLEASKLPYYAEKIMEALEAAGFMATDESADVEAAEDDLGEAEAPADGQETDAGA